MTTVQMSTEYAIPTVEPVTLPVACPNDACKHIIGTAYMDAVDKKFYLYTTPDADPAYAWHGKCKVCGAAIHWTADDARLARLMRRVKREG